VFGSFFALENAKYFMVVVNCNDHWYYWCA